MSTDNPSLGQLGLLPEEVRNRIYGFVVDSSDEEVEITKPCYPRGVLFFVSKQTR